MKAIIYIAIALLAVSASCEFDAKMRARITKCFVGSEIVMSIKEIKETGFQNFIQNKLSLPGVYKQFESVYRCLSHIISTKNLKTSDDMGVLEKFGWANLLASNCEKDLGMMSLVVDNIVKQIQSDEKDWVGIIVETVMTYFVGQQGYTDCDQFVQFVVGIFSK